MWTYSQKTGQLCHNGKVVGGGYSGIGEGLNNPDLQADPGIGPIPRGTWIMGTFGEHGRLGPYSAPLSPSGFEPFGRDGFFIHGDNAALDHTGSHGCIVFSRPLREAIANSGDSNLTVIE